MYKIVYTPKAKKDIKKLKQSKLEERAKSLISIIRENPYKVPPPCEKLSGEFRDAYSRRINIHHRLVYKVYEDDKTIKIIRMWSHYE